MLSRIQNPALANVGIGMRNRIINGNALFQQRATLNVVSVAANYATDRMIMGIQSGTGINVYCFKGDLGGTSSGKGHYFSGSATNGTPYWAQRIEAINVTDLGGQNATVSGVLYHDSGSTQSFTFRLTKPVGLDTYTSATVLQSQTVNVPSGVATPFAGVFSLSAADVANGLAVEVFSTNPITFSSKYFGLGDLQLEKGAILLPTFDVRYVGIEVLLAQRYFEKSFPLGTAPVNTATGFENGMSVGMATNRSGTGTTAPFAVRKRTAPTVTLYGNSSGYWFYQAANSTVSASANVGLWWATDAAFGFTQQVVDGTAIFVGGHWTASAEL